MSLDPARMVYIVDDDAAVRDSLALLLSLHGLATAVFARADDLLRVVRPDSRGCALVDLKMPGMSGLLLQQVLRDAAPQLAVVVITGHGDIAAARAAMKAGAIDFLEKPFDDDHLLASITAALRHDSAQSTPVLLADKVISPRERQVVERVCQGQDNTRIGEALGISARTVEVHKARVMQKIGAKTFADLFRFAASRQWISSQDRDA
jgi:two-component system, LuxR family, response regulator FixJ